MRFINVICRNLSLSQSTLSQPNFTKLWKLSTKASVSKSTKKTSEMNIVLASNLKPLFSKIYSNIEVIIKTEYYPENDPYYWRKNENVTPQIIHWIYDIDISLAQQMYRSGVVTIEEQEALRKFWEGNEEIVKSGIKNNRFYTPDIRSYQQLLKENVELFIELTEEIALKDPYGDWKTLNGESVHINNTAEIIETFIKPGNMSIFDLETKADELYNLVGEKIRKK